MGSFDNAICGHNITTCRLSCFTFHQSEITLKVVISLNRSNMIFPEKLHKIMNQKAISTWRIIYWLIINRNNIDALSPGQIEILDAVSTLIKVDKQHTCTFENKQISSYNKKRKTGISFSLLCDFFLFLSFLIFAFL